MKKILLFLVTIGFLTTQAQEYRVQQQLPDTLTEIIVAPGWDVHIIQQLGEPSSITIVTPCEIFYTQANEPEVCSIKKRTLMIHRNDSMPKHTILEIRIGNELKELNVEDSACVQTGDLYFASKPWIVIGGHAVVEGGVWRCQQDQTKMEFDIDQCPFSSFKIDTLIVTDGRMTLYKNASFQYNYLYASNQFEVRRHKKTFGTPVATDSANNILVKRLSSFTNYFCSGNKLELYLEIGRCGVPVFRNHRYGSAYNIGESYAIGMQAGFKPIVFSNNRWQLRPTLELKVEWTRLLRDVEYSDGALVRTSALQNEVVQQHLEGTSLGIPFRLSYTFGKEIELFATVGLAPTYVFKPKLVTRILGTDDRWNRSKEKVDVYNPFQLRATFGLGTSGRFMGRTSVDFFVDLLPTYRKGVGADGFHQMGVTIHL